MEDDDHIADTGPIDDSDEPSTAPEQGDELRGDIEEAVASQKAAKGDPEPYKGLRGRTDANPGGEFEGCEAYAKEARKNGTTLANAVKDYSAIETAWRGSPVRGLSEICKRTGVDPVKLAQAVLRQAQGQQPTQAQQYQAQQNYQAQAQHQAEYQRHVAEIETAFLRGPAPGHGQDRTVGTSAHRQASL
ncbi:MAG: hypothetical protein CR217_06055 [Beijerinckiaceae bacterium]|nr:MAG: hypothetical protein CR217_06055 [Beijerinckiaceae bacterium]